MTRFDGSAFDALRRDADEVNRVRTRAMEVLVAHQATSFDGIGDVLRQVIPDDPTAIQRVARILHFSSKELDGLRWGDIDPVAVARGPLATLGLLLGLDLDVFLVLVARDHARFDGDSATPRSGRAEAQLGSVGDDLKAAWSRAALDSPELA